MSSKSKKHSGKLLSPIFCLMITCWLFLYAYKTSFASVLVVPKQYPSIQQAIDAASSGDIIFIKAGTYFENITIRKSDISLEGEDSQYTVIYGNHVASVIRAINVKNVTIERLTIAGGKDKFGGGIYSESSALNITGNIVKDNKANFGGGIGAKDSNLAICENRIATNNCVYTKFFPLYQRQYDF